MFYMHFVFTFYFIFDKQQDGNFVVVLNECICIPL